MGAEVLNAIAASLIPYSRMVGVEKGIQRSGPDIDVLVASVQSLARRGSGPKRLKKYIAAGFGGLVIVDEAHHLKEGGSYDDVLTAFGLGSAQALRRHRREQHGPATCDGANSALRTEMYGTAPRVLAGFTATPYRGDGSSLRPFFDAIVPERGLRWGVANGFLCDIVAYSVKTVTDLSLIPTRAGEFASGPLAAAVDNDARNAAVARALIDFSGNKDAICITFDSGRDGNDGSGGSGHDGGNKSSRHVKPIAPIIAPPMPGAAATGARRPGLGRALVFCASVSHAHALAATLEAHGIAAGAIDASTPPEARRRLLAGFRDGALDALCNVGVLTEGFDAPACDTVVMCRPVLSKALYMQMLGRGTRPIVNVNGAGLDIASRAALIARSVKPHMKLIDFVDNCGRHKVVDMADVVGLARGFDWQGRSFCAISEMMEDAERLGISGIATIKSADDLELAVRRFRLLGDDASLPAGGSATAGAVEAVAVRELRPGDRLRGRVVVVRRVWRRWEGIQRSGGESAASAGIEAHDDGDGTRFVWRSSRLRDAEGEPLHEGARYILSATVAGTADGAVQVERCSFSLCDRS